MVTVSVIDSLDHFTWYTGMALHIIQRPKERILIHPAISQAVNVNPSKVELNRLIAYILKR